MKKWICLLALTSCTGAQMARYSEPAPQNTAFLEEMRVTLIDLKHAVNSQKMDLALLDEKVSRLSATSQTENLKQELASLKEQFASLEEKTSADLVELSSYAKQVSSALSDSRGQIASLQQHVNQQGERLDEVGKLRTTISSLSKAMSKPAEKSSKTYRVRSGDSLEKIARAQQTSIDELKKVNNLTSNKIIIGQELKIPE